MIRNPPNVILLAFPVGQLSDAFIRYLVSGEANDRFRLLGSGTLQWGPGGAAVLDVQLSRGAANRLDLAAGDSLRIADLTVGSVLFSGASGVLSQDNSMLFWDNTNKRLGIGTGTPTYTLDVSDAVTTSPVFAYPAHRVTLTLNPSASAASSTFRGGQYLCQVLNPTSQPIGTQQGLSTQTFHLADAVSVTNTTALSSQSIVGTIFGAAAGTPHSTNLTGAVSQAIHNSLTTTGVATITGHSVSADTRGPAAVTQLRGMTILVGSTYTAGPPVITNFFALELSTFGVFGELLTAGTIANAWMQRVRSFPAPTATLSYSTSPVQINLDPYPAGHTAPIGFRQQGTQAHNRFNGAVAIGQDATPTRTLDVAGDAVGQRQYRTGTSLVVGDFVLSAGWGVGAVVSSVTGNDSRFTVTITAGSTSRTANCTCTFTFKNGSWGTAPFAMVGLSGTGTAGAANDDYSWTTSDTQLVITNIPAPAATTYTYTVFVLG